MEGLTAASAVIAVVSLAGQVVQGCGYLREVFKNAITTPREIQLLAIELSIVEGLVQAIPEVEQHKEELDFCQEKLLKLRKAVEEYGEFDGVTLHKKMGDKIGNGNECEEDRQEFSFVARSQTISATHTQLVSA